MAVDLVSAIITLDVPLITQYVVVGSVLIILGIRGHKRVVMMGKMKWRPIG